MTLRNVPQSFTLEQQRQEVNLMAVDLDTAVDGIQTFTGAKTFGDTVTFSTDVTFQAQSFWGDGDQAIFGDDSDLKIYTNGTDSYIDSNTGILHIEGATDFDSHVTLIDGVALKCAFNSNIDFEIFHNGANAYLYNRTGDLYLQNDTNSNSIFIQASGGTGGISVNALGSVDLYYDQYKKFETTNTGVSVTGTASATEFSGPLTGNADTATALETARTIGGVSFDGTANIDLPGVNTAGNQDTSGNAATATALETARTIAGQSFDGTANITIAAQDLSDVDQDLATTDDVLFNTLRVQGTLSQSRIRTDGGDFVVDTYDGVGFAERLRIEDGTGNASFAGSASASYFEVTDGYFGASTTEIIQLYSGGVKKTNINNDGSALFGSNVTVTNQLAVSAADGTSATTLNLANNTSGGDNLVLVRALANGGGDAYIKFDCGGSDMVVGNLYAGTTNNKLVLGAGTDPSNVVGLTVNGVGDCTAKNITLTGQTSGSGATSDTFDHYEEGTWTPIWGSTTGSITNVTYDVQSGWYTRIGRVVYVTCRLRSTATDTSGAGGGLIVSGLPFVARTPQGTGGGAAYSLIDFPAGVINVTTEIRENTTQFYAGLYTLDNGQFGNIGPASLQSSGSSEIRASFFYMTDT